MQEILHSLIEGDKAYFHHINQEWIFPSFDKFMPAITDFKTMFPYLILVAVLILLIKKEKAFPILIGCVLCVACSDIIAARVIKPMVQRPRPEFAEKTARLIVPHQSSYSFPSNHAANVFAAATFLMLTIPGIGLLAFIVAIVVAYSRVYVGVHYPLDVFCGGLLGIFCSLIIFNIYTLIERTINAPVPDPVAPDPWGKRKYKERHRR